MSDSRNRRPSHSKKRRSTPRARPKASSQKSVKRRQTKGSITSTRSGETQRRKKTALKRTAASKQSVKQIPPNTTLWTKDPQKKKGFSLGALIKRSKVALVVVVLVAVVVVAGVADTAFNWGKIYAGVKVGEIEVGNKKIDEAAELIEDTYLARFADKQVYIFANEDARNNLKIVLDDKEASDDAKNAAIQEAQNSKMLLIADSETLKVRLNARSIAETAAEVGRSQGGLGARFMALFGDYTINPWLSYDDAQFEELAGRVDSSMGDPRINFDIEIVDGVAEVTPGHDGFMIDRDTFYTELDKAFLSDNVGSDSLVANIEYAPLQITQEVAEQTCDQVNAALQQDITFIFGERTWQALKQEAGSWISTSIEPVQGDDPGQKYQLLPHFDVDKAKGPIFGQLANLNSDTLKVQFISKNDVIEVHPETSELVPDVEKAFNQLNQVFFHEDEALPDEISQIDEGISVSLSGIKVPMTMSFDEALENGLITKISSFTTEYYPSAVARSHNIHLVSSLINDSIAPADEGIWSFNEQSGDCNEEAGFMAAGAIYENELVQEYGGGICQVATTLFNAVYEAGYPFTERYPHSLYMSDYPDGRDAAVSYPDLDFKWKNDSTSDVLVKMSYGPGWVTASLYGVSREYEVTTHKDEWQAGTKYKTITKTDSNLAAGESYIKTKGIDGKSISIVRIIKDKQGNLVSENRLSSSYNPIDEVKMVSTEAPASSDDSKNDSNDNRAPENNPPNNDSSNRNREG